MLSRGKGVPYATRDAYKRIHAALEQRQSVSAVTSMYSQRIGLEGESRLCIEFRSAQDAEAALIEIRKLAAGMDLLNVSDTPCPSRKE